MNIMYIVPFFGNPRGGLAKKLRSQISSLQYCGSDTHLTIISREVVAELADLNPKYHLTTAPPFRSLLEKLAYAKECARVLRDSLSESDVVYYRGIPVSPYLLSVLRQTRESLVVFEIQSIAHREAANRKAWLNLLTNKIFLHKILAHTDGIVGVSEAITNFYGRYMVDASKSCQTISNGVDLFANPARTPNYGHNRLLDVLCVAQPKKWHGIDRFLLGLSRYKGPREIRLHLVGNGPELERLKEMAKDLSLEDRVYFHGFKTDRELDHFYNTCQVAVSSLAIHRAGAGAPLKSREYCARGIPFVDSSLDDAFPHDFEYRLKIESNDTPLDIPMLVEFSERIMKRQDHPLVMRRFAEENLSWESKMKTLHQFLNSLLSIKKRGRN